MFKFAKRVWRYLTAAGVSKFNEHADPKIQLQQAITEAHEQHRRLKEQAAAVIGNQRQTEIRLGRAMEELEKTSSSARQAVLMADEAAKNGDTEKAAEYTATAESFAGRLVNVEAQVEDLKQMVEQTTAAAQSAKSAVEKNSIALQDKLSEQQQLLSQLDQTKMAESLNTALASLSETVGQDVPTLDEVRNKIEARYAKAIGTSELQGESVEGRMLEVETAARKNEAAARLEEIKASLGIASTTAEVTAGEADEIVVEATEQVAPKAKVAGN